MAPVSLVGSVPAAANALAAAAWAAGLEVAMTGPNRSSVPSGAVPTGAVPPREVTPQVGPIPPAGAAPPGSDAPAGRPEPDSAALRQRSIPAQSSTPAEGSTPSGTSTPAQSSRLSQSTTPRTVGWLGRDQLAIVAGLALPLALAAILVPFRTNFANTDVALAMILLVVAVAAVGNRLAGYVAAVSAAAWFDFFLTRPYEQFTINRATDIETTVLLLVIGIAVTEIAVWGRRQHATASKRAGYLDGISGAAEAAAAGDSPATLADQVSGRLAELLSLRSCSFQYGKAGLGRPAR